ncbi:MAG: [Bacteroidales bacterium]|nr:[citrate (pro-3S)-lyase] ligase [Bacteroidales bacterium]
MEQYRNLDITELPLSSTYFREKVSRFLEASGLRVDALDTYYAVQNPAGDILAGAGISGDIIKCVAVAEEARSEGLLTPLVSRIIQDASLHGIHNLKVFTKPQYRALFESLGFRMLAQAPLAVLLENGRGLAAYCEYLRSMRRSGRSGVVVMNANPFTLGHRYLLSKALEQVDTLYVIPVKEDVSMFPYAERKAMIEAAGLGDRVVVPEGSSYTISAATFPTYFLKDLSAASEEQMRLDLDLFANHIVPALGAAVRFVGSEPSDSLTARYNTLMKELLPVEVVEIERLKIQGGYVSASKVREYLNNGMFEKASAQVPETSRPYLLAELAERALRMELETPLKPGLVCPESAGAHKDMDYSVMLKGIAAIRPFFAPMVSAPNADYLRRLGIEAEEAMLAATGGVNTHRGAIYSFGLVLNAVAREMQGVDKQAFIQNACSKNAESILNNTLKDSKMHFTGTRGAREIAFTGYRQLFEDWLPFYRKERNIGRLLIYIISSLDDTCIIHRAGEKRALEVRREAEQLLNNYTEDNIRRMCERFREENISPGGAADMLALTIFIDSVI